MTLPKQILATQLNACVYVRGNIHYVTLKADSGEVLGTISIGANATSVYYKVREPGANFQDTRFVVNLYPYRKGFCISMNEIEAQFVLSATSLALVNKRWLTNHINLTEVLELIDWPNKVNTSRRQRYAAEISNIELSDVPKSNIEWAGQCYTSLSALSRAVPEFNRNSYMVSASDEDLQEVLKQAQNQNKTKGQTVRIGNQVFNDELQAADYFLVTVPALKKLLTQSSSWQLVTLERAIKKLPDADRTGVKVAGRYWTSYHAAANHIGVPEKVLRSIVEQNPDISMLKLSAIGRNWILGRKA